MTKTIKFYLRKDPYGWLSNFHRCQVVVDRMPYPTNEHFYQSQRAKHKGTENWIATAPSAWLAMKAGRALRPGKGLRDDWDDETRKLVMLMGLRAKFRNEDLRIKLLETGDAVLGEDSPTDMFWGIRGENWLGILLMQVRDEIRDEIETSSSG